MRRARTLGLSILVALAAAPVPAFAKDDKPGEKVSAESKAKAAAKFKEGEKAFKRHDYVTAAAAFEEAYAIAPHPAALFNAATAHEKAGELTRAANLCARYLRDAPENDSRREKANALIGELTPKLGRVEVEQRNASDVTIDGQPAEDEQIFVDPGDHVVAGRFGSKAVDRKISVVAGSLVRVVLEPPKKETDTALSEEGDTDASKAKQKDDSKKEKPKPLPPAVFYTGVALTVVVGGVAVWSGLDTNKARTAFDQNPTQTGLDDGRSKQKRTNVLLGVTGVAAVGTAVIGLFFTDWKRGEREKPPSDVSLRVGPGFVGAAGRF